MNNIIQLFPGTPMTPAIIEETIPETTSGTIPIADWTRSYDEYGFLILPYFADPIAAEIAEEQIVLLTEALERLVRVDELRQSGVPEGAINTLDRVAIMGLLQGSDLAAFEILHDDEEELVDA